MGIDLDLSRLRGKTPREKVTELSRIKFVRYSSASAAGVIAGQAALFLFIAGFDWRWVPANLASVAVGSTPNYLINRYWTWQQRGKNRLWTEIMPFWTMGLLGTLLSIVTVAYAENRWDAPIVANIAQLAAFGVLWFAKFLILDKLIWKVVHELHPEVEFEGEQGEQRDTPAVTPSGEGTPSGNGERPATDANPAQADS